MEWNEFGWTGWDGMGWDWIGLDWIGLDWIPILSHPIPSNPIQSIPRHHYIRIKIGFKNDHIMYCAFRDMTERLLFFTIPTLSPSSLYLVFIAYEH